VVAAAYLAVAIACSWPLALHIGSATVQPLGDPLLNAWILAWDANRVLHGFQGYWTGLFFYPYPDTVAYSEHLLGIALFTAPLQWWTGNPVLSLNVAIIGAAALAGFGTWLLARDVCGRDDAAFVAGLAFACSPLRVPHVTHLQVLMSGWIPVSLWALERYFGTGRRRWLAAWVVAFLLNAGSNGYYLFFASIPTLFIVLRGVWRDRARAGRIALEFGTACIATLAVLAPIAAAYLRVRRDQGLWRTLSTVRQYSPDVTAYVAASPSLWLWGGVLPRGGSEMALFPGLMIVALGAAALATAGSSAPDRRTCHGTRPGVSDTWLYLAIATAALVLSLGPEPKIFGWQAPLQGPYGWLRAVLPGLDGLRVPARLATIVSLALAVLGALGLERLTRPMTTGARLAVAAACGLAVTAEGYAGPYRLERVPDGGMRADAVAYEWLRAQPPGPVIELPVGGTPTRVRYVVATLVHGHRIVNGYSGYGSALQGFVGVPFGEIDRLEDALQMARALGVRWIGVHPPLFGADRAPGDALVRALRAAADQVSRVEDFGSMAIAELRPGAPVHVGIDPAWQELPPRSFHAAASVNASALPLAFDGDAATRWSSGAAQRGREWIELTFEAPRDLSCVRLEANRFTEADYPRGLVVASSADGVRFETLFSGGVADRLAISIVTEPRQPGIAIVLPPNATRVLRLSTIGGTRALYWSVSELRVWTRAPVTAPLDRLEGGRRGSDPGPARSAPVRPSALSRTSPAAPASARRGSRS
jgi:hypothetical protein